VIWNGFEHESADRLRGEVAAAQGLPANAASFIQGESVGELETSASKLAKLIDTQGVREQPRAVDPVAGLLTRGASVKAQHSRQLLQSLHGIPTRPRDERGRFKGGGMDGGARRSLPPSRPESHEQWLTRVLRSGSADRGASF